MGPKFKYHYLPQHNVGQPSLTIAWPFDPEEKEREEKEKAEREAKEKGTSTTDEKKDETATEADKDKAAEERKDKPPKAVVVSGKKTHIVTVNSKDKAYVVRSNKVLIPPVCPFSCCACFSPLVCFFCVAGA